MSWTPTLPTDGIDLQALAPLKRDKPQFYCRLLATFLRHTPTLLASIERAIAVEAHADIARAAHSLKSSSANVGAVRLSALAGRLEAAASSGDVIATIAGARDLAQHYAEVQHGLTHEMNETTGLARSILRSA